MSKNKRYELLFPLTFWKTFLKSSGIYSLVCAYACVFVFLYIHMFLSVFAFVCLICVFLFLCVCALYACESQINPSMSDNLSFLRSISIHTWRSPISKSGWSVTWDYPGSLSTSHQDHRRMECRAFNMVLGLKLGQPFYSLSPILILLVFTIFRWYSLRVSPIGMLDVVIANFSETIKWFSCMDSFISLYT